MVIKNKKMVFVSICALSFIIGSIVGSIDALFGSVLLWITDFRTAHFLYLIPFLSLGGMLFMFVFLKYGKNSSQGMGLIFQVGNKEENEIPKRLVPLVIVGTWMTHLFGGSAGREGVAVQLGATVAHWVGRFLKGVDFSQFIVIGMAAGFAGLFQTPLAATFFAMEVLIVGKLRIDAFLPTLIAAYTASTVSHFLGLEKASFSLDTTVNFTSVVILKLVVAAVIFGFVGWLFSMTLCWTKVFLAKQIPSPVVRIGLVGIGLSIMLFLAFQGRYSGLGTNLITDSFSGNQITSYDWLLKLVFTIVTIAAGFQGGEVTPLFSIGATLGVVLGMWLGLPIFLMAALGYAAVFGSATNTFFAPILIGGEIFGFASLPYFMLVCGIAFFCNRNRSIYGNQKVLKELIVVK